ncbi:MAG: hypothetical protein PHO57_09070 [Acidithiobacillus sp.]|nr:hypothetical protein [Acidithiobacillus sp.]
MTVRQMVKLADEKLLAFFERPAPRRAAERALWLVTHVETLFFLPFKFFVLPATWLLERHARRAQQVRDKVRKGGGFL